MDKDAEIAALRQQVRDLTEKLTAGEVSLPVVAPIEAETEWKESTETESEWELSNAHWSDDEWEASDE